VSRLTLWQRLALLFAALLLASFAAAAWLQMGQSMRQGQQVEQQLFRHLAGHVAGEIARAGGTASPSALSSVAQRLQATNPGVDLYLLDTEGRILSRFPGSQPLQRPAVDVEPIARFFEETTGIVLGDDPLSTEGRKVFSAAALPPGPDAESSGFVYVVLQGSAYDMAAALAGRSGALQVALWSIGLVTPLALLAGLLAFREVARPIVHLTREVEGWSRAEVVPPPTDVEGAPGPVRPVRDEIAILRAAFEELGRSNARHRHSLIQLDQQRREWIATISHDLRTPLASMRGYLETVLLQGESLGAAQREKYLQTALSQAQRLSRLAEELLELARLELGAVKPKLEVFSMVELAQDVMHKLALSAASHGQALVPEFSGGAQPVLGDIGMIERVLTNLLDNAIRHTPSGGEIRVRLQPVGALLRVEVIDSGPGIPPDRRPDLFAHRLSRPPNQHGGGLGLAIVKQILQLHGRDIELRDAPGGGAAFAFLLPCAS
jgi:signal transduction histidine kinase